MSIVNHIKRPLSGSEMVKLLPGTIILTYDELVHFDDIEFLLGKTRQFVVLYMTAETSGHWCCVFVNDTEPDKIQFFCSYGEPVDSKQFQNVPMEIMVSKNQCFSYLSELMVHSRYKHISCNNFRVQGRGVSTCGRFVALRLWLKNLRDHEFFMFMNMSRYTPDKLATALTENVFNNYPLSPLVICVPYPL